MQELIGTIIWLKDRFYPTVKVPYLYMNKDQKYVLLHEDENGGNDVSGLNKYDGKRVRITGDFGVNFDADYLTYETVEEVDERI